jgi:hypothetical protein
MDWDDIIRRLVLLAMLAATGGSLGSMMERQMAEEQTARGKGLADVRKHIRQ